MVVGEGEPHEEERVHALRSKEEREEWYISSGTGGFCAIPATWREESHNREACEDTR